MSESLLEPPVATMIRQTREMMVMTIGVKMHAKRPSLPMVAVFCVRLADDSSEVRSWSFDTL